MERKKLQQFQEYKDPEKLKETFDKMISSGILIIPIAKKPESKSKMLATQNLFAKSKSQAYAMYMNYINCGLGAEMRARLTLIKKDKLFIYGHCNDGTTQRNMVVTIGMISKTRMISYVEI